VYGFGRFPFWLSREHDGGENGRKQTVKQNEREGIMTIIEIKDIRTDGGTQAREKLDPATLQRYTELLREARQEETAPETVWPFKANIEVHYDGSVYWLIDGFHRVAACKEVGQPRVRADVSQGTQRDAILESFSANADHGLPRSSEDKRRAINRMLNDEEWGQWSDREIARRCKVSHPTVAAIRAELAEVTGKFTSERMYKDKHGNDAVMNVAAIGTNGAVKNSIVYEADDVYAWLRDYEDGMGRRWYDLEDTQVHHANSPCFQAYMKSFPGQTDPRYLLKRALHRLQADGKADSIFADDQAAPVSAESTEPISIDDTDTETPDLQVWEVERLVRLWHAEPPPIRADARYNLDYFCAWLERNNYNTRRNYAKQALNNVQNLNRRKEETTNTHSEVRHAIAEANREARAHFPAESPAFFYHGWVDMGDTHPQYHFLRTATVDYPAELVAEELAALCQCNPLPSSDDNLMAYLQLRAEERKENANTDAFLDRAIANEAAEIAEMFPAEDEPASDGDEWYTPTWLIEKAKQVMGGIDIDPASSRAAQERVQASLWMGKDYALSSRGALGVNWVINNGPHWQPARIWLNPPYSFPLVGQFVEKLLEQIEKGYVGEAILLVNNNTETDWWHKAAAAAAVTFTFRSRVFFWRPGREDATSPRQGQVAFYFGPNVLDFIEEFKDKGMSFMRWDVSAFADQEMEMIDERTM
jgi:hypothetical protein